MYEEFRHPTTIAAKEQYDDLLLARRTKIEEYLTENNIPITEAIIEKYWRGYKRRLKREFRSRVRNTGLYVFAELPIAFLDFEVPNALPWNTKEINTGTEEEPVIESVKRTVREYLAIYNESLDGTKVLFALGGKPVTGSRPKGVTRAEIDIWRTLLESRGFDWANAGTIAQWRQRLTSPAYSE
jgi:hypothetical protein